MLLYMGLGLLVAFVLAMVFGVGKNTIFRNPGSLSNGQIERTIVLTARIMDNARIGSKEWTEAGEKYSAALREQRKRQGLPDLDWDTAKGLDDETVS